MNDNQWAARCDVFRQTTDFSDLLKVVASSFEMYSKGCAFVGPWIAKQSSAMAAPTKDEIIAGVGKVRPCINSTMYSRFVESIFDFAIKSNGRRAMITPNITTHHSAQYPAGTFRITSVPAGSVTLRDERAVRRPSKSLFKLELAGADAPVYIEYLPIPADQIKFVIIRPKLGKLGSASVKKWEVLFYKHNYGYIIDHVDSDLNPRWAGIM